MSVQATIQALRDAWSIPRPPLSGPTVLPDFLLSCSFADRGGVTAGELDRLPKKIPDSLRDFWQIAASARLFEDRTYGQWGLVILSRSEALARTRQARRDRPRQYWRGDLVVGEFRGDSDLLVVRCGPGKPDFGRVLVALPIDPRWDWYEAAHDFEAFLERYAAEGGEKFWEADHRAAMAREASEAG